MIKKIWKPILIFIIYSFCAIVSLGLSQSITEIFKGSDYSLTSILTMAITLMCILTIVGKSILKIIFKEETDTIISNSSKIYLPVGVIVSILGVSSLYMIFPRPDDYRNPLSLFVLTLYLFLPIILGVFGIIFAAFTFLLLRLSIKYTKIIYIIAIISSIFWFMSINQGTKNVLDDIARPGGTILDMYTTNNWYFVYNDRIYCYALNNGNDEFYSVNLKGKDKKIISTSNELRFAEFYLVKDNEAYYYTTYSESVKKINLTTGVIKDVHVGYLSLLSDTLNENKVLAGYSDNNVDTAHSYCGWINLDTGIIVKDKKMKRSSSKYYYDIDNDKVYYIVYENNNYNVYEDNNIIFTAKNNISSVFAQNGFLFITYNNTIIKLDLKNYNVISKIQNRNVPRGPILNSRPKTKSVLGKNEGSINIGTNISGYNYFCDNTDKLYVFNDEKIEFEQIADCNGIEYVQSFGNYVLFQAWDKVLLYNPKTKEIKEYGNIMNYSTQNNILYLLIVEGDRYSYGTGTEFHVEKISFNK